MTHRPAPSRDRGAKTSSTAVEWLAVAILLGVLAGVVVFVVNGVTG
ncbi:MAG TPA: hypothetical protein VM242_08115 [Acidimicrobiales bacterium]|jgi:hypothetical protein|nr:hypothetical protein [Acidimicrobiales bacterium]